MMKKFKAASKNKNMSAIEDTQPILKEQGKKKKKKKNKRSTSENKNDSKISHAKDRKHTQDIKGSGAAVKRSKTDDKTIKILPKIQSNTKDEAKSKKQKHDKSSDQANNVEKIDAFKAKKVKKLQVPAKETIMSEEKKEKINKIKLINLKKIKKEERKNKKELQQVETDKILKLNKRKIKIKRLEEMLNTSKVQQKKSARKLQKQQLLTLKDRMMAQLKSSRFRFINETLYNNNSSQSKQYFKDDPDAFKAYHDGYKYQLKQWPVNPLDIIISSIKKMPIHNIIADFGCGEAKLAISVPHKVHSFDFIALNDRVQACDMAHTPLLMDSVHIVVFCLSLMGTNLDDYLREANRVLKNNGILKIAEVESRFDNVEDFIRLLGSYGFKNTWKDLSYNLFYFMDFKKVENMTGIKRKNFPIVTLKPCLYKKR